MTAGLRTRVGVLVSGAGTNLEALLRACSDETFPGEVVLVVSNRRSAPALHVAARHGVSACAMPQSDFGDDSGVRDRAMLQRLRSAGVQLVVCAGYDRILSDEFLAALPDAILNVHPSLLPAFAGGMHAVEDALAFGVKVTGCTVQLLESGVTDGGPVVLQAAVPVEPDDDADTLRARIHTVEWTLLPRAVSLWCEGRLHRDGRRVQILDEASPNSSRRHLLRTGDAGGKDPARRVSGSRAGGCPEAAGPVRSEKTRDEGASLPGERSQHEGVRPS